MAEQRGTQTITSTSDQQKSVPVVTVESFYGSHAEKLQMKLEGPRVGFHRKIREPTINRPGLALSGFYIYFAEKRIQVLGAAELAPARLFRRGKLYDVEDHSERWITLTQANLQRYQQALQAHLDAVQQFCHRHEILYARVSTASSLPMLVTEELTRAGLLAFR